MTHEKIIIVNIFTNQAIPKTSDFALTQTACFFVVVDLEIAIKREEHLFSTFSRTRKKKCQMCSMIPHN